MTSNDPWNGDYLPDGTLVPLWPTVNDPGSPEAAVAVAERAGDDDDGALVLDAVEAFLRRFVAYPSEHEVVAHVLWIVHAWFMDVWDSTPRIAFLSPEPGSGKSRALEVTEPLVPRPVQTVNVSPAYLFRKVSDEAGRPTVLADEVDTLFGPRAKDNEEVRGMFNAGHRKGAVAGRCVVRGKQVFTEELPAYCAVALAGLDDLPDTIQSRSVVVRMRRRAPGERVEPWRPRVQAPAADALRERIAEWADTVGDVMGARWPDMPDGVEDRAADVWEALLRVADVAGGRWPQRARLAAVTLVEKAKDTTMTLGVQLLRDLHTVFVQANTGRLRTEYVLTKLHDLEESPWGDLPGKWGDGGKPLDARGLARRLRRYGIRPQVQRDGSEVSRGYDAADLRDAWARYLPPEEPPAQPQEPATAVTAVTGVTDAAGVTPATGVTRSPGGSGATANVTTARGTPAPCPDCGEPLDEPGALNRCRPNHNPKG